jgi:putative hydrolase of the HAD superfamily
MAPPKPVNLDRLRRPSRYDGTMIRAIVFDFGNVVGYFDHRRVSRRLAAHVKRPAEELHPLIFGCDLEDDYEAGRIDSAEFLRALRERCRVTCTEEELIEAYADIFWPNPDVCALLPQLKPRYRLLLGSNTTELHAARFREQFADALAHFDALVLSYEVGARKPHADFFARCRELAGCAASECVFIDDAAVNVAGARASGLHGIIYTDIARLHRQLAELGVHEAG